VKNISLGNEGAASISNRTTAVHHGGLSWSFIFAPLRLLSVTKGASSSSSECSPGRVLHALRLLRLRVLGGLEGLERWVGLVYVSNTVVLVVMLLLAEITFPVDVMIEVRSECDVEEVMSLLLIIHEINPIYNS